MFYMNRIGNQTCRCTQHHDNRHNKRRYAEVEETAHGVGHTGPNLADEEVLQRQEYDYGKDNNPLGLGQIQLVDFFVPVPEYLKKPFLLSFDAYFYLPLTVAFFLQKKRKAAAIKIVTALRFMESAIRINKPWNRRLFRPGDYAIFQDAASLRSETNRR